MDSLPEGADGVGAGNLPPILPPDSSLTILAYGSPLSVPGKIQNATRLDGSQWLDLIESTNRSCLTNLALCRHGLTIALWVKFREYEGGMFYLSTGGWCGGGGWGGGGRGARVGGSGVNLYYNHSNGSLFKTSRSSNVVCM